LHKGVPSDARLIGVILDQIQALPAAPLQLPMPSDCSCPESRRSAENRIPLTRGPEAAREICGGESADYRAAVRSETKHGIWKWRQRLRLLHALRLLAAGEQVTNVALEAGYDSTSAFISMFRRELWQYASRTTASYSRLSACIGSSLESAQSWNIKSQCTPPKVSKPAELLGPSESPGRTSDNWLSSNRLMPSRAQSRDHRNQR